MIIRYDAYGNRDYGWEEQDRVLEKNNERRRNDHTHDEFLRDELRWLLTVMSVTIAIVILFPFLPVYFFWNRVGGMGKAGLVLAGFVLWYPWIFAVGWGLTHWAGH